MARICNFPISQDKRCKHPITDGRPNCGRHHCEVSARQLGQSPVVYRKNDELHVWAGDPDGLYCLIHNDPAYQVLCQLTGEVPPCCLRESISWKDEGGRPHRDDGPAIIEADGTRKWYQHGKLHRDGEPAVIRANGVSEWRQYGELHRDGGPAMTGPDGMQVWYQNGKRHREDGPADVWADGTQEWYWHGKEVTETKHARLREQSENT